MANTALQNEIIDARTSMFDKKPYWPKQWDRDHCNEIADAVSTDDYSAILEEIKVSASGTGPDWVPVIYRSDVGIDRATIDVEAQKRYDKRFP